MTITFLIAASAASTLPKWWLVMSTTGQPQASLPPVANMSAHAVAASVSTVLVPAKRYEVSRA